MASAHLFVDDLENPVVAEEDRHHVERVLRIRAGEAVSVSDGAGGFRECEMAAGGELRPAGAIRREEPPRTEVAVGFALVKNERPEWIVQKLTECGVDRILPFLAARSVVRWDEQKRRRHLERWRVVAREAAMQSRRVWLPSVEGIVDFDAFDPGCVVLADMEGEPPTADGRPVLIGPEGGWDPTERGRVHAKMRLSDRVLRAETAAVAAGVVLCGLRSGLLR